MVPSNVGGSLPWQQIFKLVILSALETTVDSVSPLNVNVYLTNMATHHHFIILSHLVI